MLGKVTLEPQGKRGQLENMLLFLSIILPMTFQACHTGSEETVLEGLSMAFYHFNGKPDPQCGLTERLWLGHE